MIFLYIVALLLSFYILAKVVDEYFIAALDKIAEKLKMSSDAAGATLMAVGSSAPELFVAIFAVLRPGDHASIGVGNIVGSALFNILAITGAAAIVRKAIIAWQAVARDLFFYAISILLLLFTLYDGVLTYYESGLLILTYIIYVIVVIYWQKIFKYTDPNENVKEDVIVKEKTEKSFFEKIMFPIDFILNLLFPNKKYYTSIFFISIVIIAAVSWVLVESAIEIAHILNISEAILAVTVLAVGTSIPDLLSSIIVSKQGRGGMAISNAVGSNIFDILMGLGLPFLIVIISMGGKADIDVGNIHLSVYFLLASVFVVFFLFILNKWKVGKIFGVSLLLIYFIYIIWAIFSI